MAKEVMAGSIRGEGSGEVRLKRADESAAIGGLTGRDKSAVN